jgi:hypothetical protein
VKVSLPNSWSQGLRISRREWDREIVKLLETARWKSRGKDISSQVRYLRWNRGWLLGCIPKAASYFPTISVTFADFRRDPYNLWGYLITSIPTKNRGKFRGQIEVSDEFFALFESKFTKAATESVEEIAKAFRGWKLLPYPHVRTKVEGVWKRINKQRVAAGREIVPKTVVKLAFTL